MNKEKTVNYDFFLLNPANNSFIVEKDTIKYPDKDNVTMIDSLKKEPIPASTFLPSIERAIQIAEPTIHLSIYLLMPLPPKLLEILFEERIFNKAQTITEILVAIVTPRTPMNLLRIMLKIILKTIPIVLLIIGCLESPYAY